MIVEILEPSQGQVSSNNKQNEWIAPTRNQQVKLVQEMLE